MNKCPICHKEIATDALTCPHCGHPLKKSNKELPVMLKRERISYTLDLLIMFLPLSLIALMLLNHYLLILAIPLALLCLIWGILSIKKKRINNHMIKDLIYYDQDDKSFTFYPLNQHEYKINTNLVIKIKKENLITQRIYLTIKEMDENKINYHTKTYDLGYSTTKDLKAFKDKLKTIIEIDMSVEE